MHKNCAPALLIFFIILLCYPSTSAEPDDEILTGDLIKVRYEMDIAQITDAETLLLQEFIADIPEFTAPVVTGKPAVQTKPLNQTTVQVPTTPDENQDLITLGKTQLRDEQWSQAEATFRTVLENNESSKDGWEGYFHALNNQEKYNELLAASQKSITLIQDFALGYYYEGEAYDELELYDNALKAYDTALLLDPENTSFLFSKGLLLEYHYDDYPGALKVYQKLTEIKPDSAYYWSQVAETYADLGLTNESVTASEKAIQLEPDEGSYWRGLGFVLLNGGRYEQALQAYEKANQLEKESDRRFRYIGDCLVNLGRTDEAMEAYKKALLSNESSVQSRITDLSTYIGLKEEIEKNPKNYTAWYKIGDYLDSIYGYNEALTAYEKVLQINPWMDEEDLYDLHTDEDSFWHYSMAAVYEDLNRNEEALGAYDKAIDLDPTNMYHYTGKAEFLNEIGEPTQANETLEQGLNVFRQKIQANSEKIYESDFEYEVTLLDLLKRYEEALNELEKGIKLFPDDDDLWELKAEMLQKTGRCGEAITAYDTAINLIPDDYSYKAVLQEDRQELLDMMGKEYPSIICIPE